MNRTNVWLILVIGILIGALVVWFTKGPGGTTGSVVAGLDFTEKPQLTSAIISLDDSGGNPCAMIDKTELFRVPRNARKYAAWLVFNACASGQDVRVTNFRLQNQDGSCPAAAADKEGPFEAVERQQRVEPRTFAFLLLKPKTSPELTGTTWCYDLYVGTTKTDPRLKFDP